MDAGFDCWDGDGVAASPVVISVPHAGRDYPLMLRAALRVPLAAAASLEDRHVDAVAIAARRREAMLIQRRARAWIDLNRGEDERDPLVDEGAGTTASPSAKLASGLGLVPRRTATGDLWRRRWSDAAVQARIAGDHRPYHAALDGLLAAARARWGVAVLIDLHSMPPLGGAARGARVVLGDRYAQAADPRFVARAEAAMAAAGLTVAINTPYAGGHVLARHARPAAHVHGIQVELDRSLYLDRTLQRPDAAGVAATAAAVRALIDSVADEALGGGATAAGAGATLAAE